MEWNGIRRLKKLIGDGVFHTLTDLAEAMNEPDANIRNWLVKNMKPSRAKQLRIDTFLEKYGVGEKHSDRSAIVLRKAALIANKLEETVPLMKWFVDCGNEEDRNQLRATLGTDLSYDIFDAARALLTEKHLEKAKQEGS